MYLAAAIRSSTSNAVAVVPSPSNFALIASLPSLRASLKEDKSRAITVLSLAIDSVAFTKDVVGIEVVKTALSAACVLLTMIRVSLNQYYTFLVYSHAASKDTMSNDEDLVDLSLHCTDICLKLKRATFGKRETDISDTTKAAVSELHG